ncbi:MAG: ABC transporter permease, partial [Chloroflexi bacterium]|nr:ABC transporter permease [Chloroflexota bacterium]
MTLALITSILWVTIRAGTSLLYATVGEILTERAGILNLGVEGIMIVGAVTGFAAAFHTKQVWVGVGVAMLAGAAMASIHAFLSVSLRAEQVVSGLALTIFGTGLANYLGQRLGPGGAPLVGMVGPKFTPVPLSALADVPLLGKSVFNQDILTYATYLLVPLLWFFLNRTRPGLHLRAVGENPQTADAMGVNVTGIRYLYTIVGGM